MMQVRDLGMGVLELIPKKIKDHRGFFSETFNLKHLAEAGVTAQFVQDNHSFSGAIGTLRGLHFQTPPFAQDKLVRVAGGAIFDVAVDIRTGSPSFGQWVGLTISANAWNQIYIPKGFAHGFLTLEADTEVLYKTSDFYSAPNECTFRYDDPAVAINWPQTEIIELSDRDRAAPVLSEIEPGFVYDPV